MSEESQNVLRAALRSPITEREEVAAGLLASLEGNADGPAEAAGPQEIERRARRARDGLSAGADWQAVRRRIEERLGEQ